MRWVARLAALVLLVAAMMAGIAVTPTPTTADCGSQSSPPDAVGVAFQGSVTDVEEVREGSFAVTVAVDRTLVGPSQRTVTFETGDYADCHMIDGSALHHGDELVVIGKAWWKERVLAYPFAWRQGADGGWGLSVIAPDNRRRLPADLRSVDTYPEILAFIGAGLPPTDAEPAAESTFPAATFTTELFTAGDAQDELFRLTIETASTRYAVGEAIPITTTLTYAGSAPTITVTHAHGGVVAFGIEQLDGPLDAGPGRRMSCVTTTFVTGDVQSVPFGKSGGYDEDDPLAPMWSAWLHDPLVRPPAGVYRIDAVAEYGPAECGASASLTASVTVEVVDGGSASPNAAIEVPPDSAPPEAVLDNYLRALMAGDCAAARALATDTFTIGNGELCGAVTVSAVTVHPGGPARPSDHEAVFATTITVTGGDAAMPDGDLIWFYALERQPDGVWRLTGGGSGP